MLSAVGIASSMSLRGSTMMGHKASCLAEINLGSTVSIRNRMKFGDQVTCLQSMVLSSTISLRYGFRGPESSEAQGSFLAHLVLGSSISLRRKCFA